MAPFREWNLIRTKLFHAVCFAGDSFLANAIDVFTCCHGSAKQKKIEMNYWQSFNGKCEHIKDTAYIKTYY